jgi:hypothetical protein
MYDIVLKDKTILEITDQQCVEVQQAQKADPKGGAWIGNRYVSFPYIASIRQSALEPLSEVFSLAEPVYIPVNSENVRKGLLDGIASVVGKNAFYNKCKSAIEQKGGITPSQVA